MQASLRVKPGLLKITERPVQRAGVEMQMPAVRTRGAQFRRRQSCMKRGLCRTELTELSIHQAEVVQNSRCGRMILYSRVVALSDQKILDHHGIRAVHVMPTRKIAVHVTEQSE